MIANLLKLASKDKDEFYRKNKKIIFKKKKLEN